MTEMRSWTAAAPPAAVRLAGSQRVHGATVLAGSDLLIPACGAGLGQPSARVPILEAAAVTCPACRRIGPAQP